jgi:hypothetical protein
MVARPWATAAALAVNHLVKRAIADFSSTIETLSMQVS